MGFKRITFETAGGRLIDIVDRDDQAVHDIYILSHNLEELVGRVKELGIDLIDKKIFKLLRSEDLIKVRRSE